MAALRQIASGMEALTARLARLERGPLVTALRWVIPALLVGILGYNLYHVGLSRVWLAPPTSPAFYIALLFLPVLLPAADLIIYRYLWNTASLPLLSALLRKRYMNSLVLDYSGEAYFLLWARKNVQRPDNVILHSIKDSNVLSAGAGLGTTAIVLVLVLAVNGPSTLGLAGATLWPMIMAAAIPAILCLVLVAGGARVTALSRLQMASVFLIHFVRSGGALALDFALWWLSGALPSAVVCLEFVALKVLVTRLPVVPSKNLLYAGVAITAASYLNASTPRVTAVVIMMAAFEQLLAVAVIGIPWLFERLGLGDTQGESTAEFVAAGERPLQHLPPVPPVGRAVYDPRPD